MEALECHFAMATRLCAAVFVYGEVASASLGAALRPRHQPRCVLLYTCIIITAKSSSLRHALCFCCKEWPLCSEVVCSSSRVAVAAAFTLTYGDAVLTLRQFLNVQR
jgi:hypothetical protein